MGTWSGPGGNGANWVDVPTLFHENVNTMSFVDGHAEHRKWLDGPLVKAGLLCAQGWCEHNVPATANSADGQFITDHWNP